MKFTVCTTGWNEATNIIPFIRYYLKIQHFDKFIYYDNFSEDNTVDIIKKEFNNDSRIVIDYTPYKGHLPEQEVHLINRTMEKDENDVFMWVDSDEIIYHENLKQYIIDNYNNTGKNYLCTYMTNVFNNSNTFNPDLYNIVDNFEIFFQDVVLKCPAIVKNGLESYYFEGGHHTVRINDVKYGWKVNNPADIVDQAHLFHFTYINTNTYLKRKTQGRQRNLSMGVHNGWYDTYWNFNYDQVNSLIESQKAQGLTLSQLLAK